jgi:hypothetical protein
MTTAWAWEKTVVTVKQAAHLSSMKKTQVRSRALSRLRSQSPNARRYVSGRSDISLIRRHYPATGERRSLIAEDGVEQQLLRSRSTDRLASECLAIIAQ